MKIYVAAKKSNPFQGWCVCLYMCVFLGVYVGVFCCPCSCVCVRVCMRVIYDVVWALMGENDPKKVLSMTHDVTRQNFLETLLTA